MSQPPRDYRTESFNPQPQSEGTPPMPPPTAIGTIVPPEPPRRNSNLPIIIALVVLLLVAGGVGLFFALNNNGSGNTVANVSATPTSGSGNPTNTASGSNPTNTSAASNPTDTSAPPTPAGPPAALGISPAPDTRNIPPQAPIAVTFNQPMDHASAEAAFKIEPAVQGSFGWLDNLTASTLVFTPSVGYRPGTSYTVSLSSAAKSSSQQPLTNAAQVSTSFQTVPLAEVFRAIPASDSKDIPTDATVALQFTRPMIPLTTVGKEQNVAGNITFDPPLAGRFVWLGTTELQFQPRNGLSGGTKYNVTVHKQLQDQFGATLAKDYSYSFTTISPRVTYVYPTDQKIALNDPTFYGNYSGDNNGVGIPGPGSDYVGNVGATSPIVVTFNQLMDHASVQSNFSIAPIGTAITQTGGLSEMHLAAPIEQSNVSGNFAWGAGAGPAEVMTFTPASPLALNTQFRATVGAAAKPQGGSIGLDKDYIWTFSTFPPLAVTDVKFGPDGIDLTFNNPLKLDSIKSNWQVQPQLTYSSTNASYSGSSPNFSIYAHLDPSATYTVLLNGDIEDVAGQKLATPFRKSGTTPSAVPSVNILGANGQASFNHGQPTNLYIGSVNGTQLNYYLWKLDAPNFASLISAYSFGLHEGKSNGGFQIANLKPTRQWTQTVTATKDQPNVSKLALSLDGQADRLPPGYYAFVVELDRSNYLADSPDQFGQEASLAFVVGDSALTMKAANNEALVWAVNQNTGKPSANLRVRLASVSNGAAKLFATGRTDADGLYRTPITGTDTYSLFAIAEGDNGSDTAAVSANWSDGINSGDFVLYRWNTDRYYSYNYPSGQYSAYLYSDRPIYRPGQTVNFKGIVRADKDAAYSLPSNVNALLTINDGNHDVYSQTVQLGSNGSFDGQFALDQHAALGGYQLRLTITDPNQVLKERRTSDYYYSFTVQEYRKPQYQVDVKTDKDSYINGDTIHTSATASYYFGGAVANASMTVRILTADYFFAWSDPQSGAAYDFYDYDALYNRSQAQVAAQRQQRQLTTDAHGQVNIDTKADLSQVPTSQQYTIEAAVTDASNQEVANSAVVTVHKGQFYVGLRPDLYVATASQPFTVSVVTVKPDGSLSGNQTVKLTLYSRTWQNTQDKDQSGATVYVYKPVDTQVSQQTVTTDANGRAAQQFTATQGGQYVVRAAAQDAAGNTITSATSIYVAPPDGGAASWKRDNTNRVDLVSDKKLYAVGDSAKVLVTSPYTSATALLTTERDGIRSTQVFPMHGNTAVLPIPIDEGSVPNIYASLTIVNSLADGADAPSFRQGYVELRVDPKVKQLNLTITPDKPQYGPRDTANFTIKATDSAGQPVQADLSIAVVDKAIFALAADSSGTLVNNFYANRALGVRTASSLAILRAQNQAYDRYASPGAGVAAGGGGAKGGGGGGGGALTVRTNLQDTAFWKGSITTAADGTANVAVPLPDNLTTWRVTAKAVTTDTKVGEAITDVLVSKPLLIQPALPLFLLQGDTANPAAIIHNYTQSDQQVDVSLAITGTHFVDASGVTTSTDGTQQTATQHVTIKAGDQAKVQWSVLAGTGTRAGFTIAARSANNGPSDALGIDIPINPFVTPEVTAASGVITNTLTQTLLIPYGVDSNIGGLNISLSASLAGSALDGVQYNIDYLYSGTEQTVSRFLPLLYVEDTFKAAGQKSPYSGQLPALLNSSIQRLYTLQHKDGGWGYWDENPYSSDYPYLTAYALEGLLKARAEGVAVDASAIDRAVQYLKDKLAAKTGQGSFDYANLDDPSTRAYILDVLALAGESSAAAQLDQLAQTAQDKLTIFGRAHLVLGLLHSGQQQAASAALQPLVAAAKLQGSATAHWQEDRTAHYYYINMDSDTRSTALAAQAILALNPNDQLAAQAVRWLMQNRSADAHWASTQETSQVIILLAQYVAAQKELLASFGYSVKLDGKAVGDGKFDQSNLTATAKLAVQIKDMLINQTSTLVISRDSGAGPLYYNLNLRYFIPGQGIAAYNNGLGVTRTYLPPASPTDAQNPPAPISSVSAGDFVHVRLTVIVPQDSYYVTIEDPLPAGMEAVNTDLGTTSTAAKQAGVVCIAVSSDEKSSAPCRSYDGVEMHDDRVTYFATFLAAGVYNFDYAMRATTPGSYYALPTRAYLMYSPETWGRSDGEQFTVK